MFPSVSIIIPSYNRPHYFSDLLISIGDLESANIEFEVLVVDNNSSPANRKLLEKQIMSAPFSINLILEQKPGLHNVRHRGLREAQGEILIYLDDDTMVGRSWLTAAVEPFESTDKIIVFGKVLPKFSEKPPAWMEKCWSTINTTGKYLGQLSLIDLGDEAMEASQYQYVPGCNLAIRKRHLEDLGGFHPDSMPDDLIKFRGDGETALCQKAFQNGYKFYYSPKMQVFHQIPKERMTIEYFCHRMFLQGISDSFSSIRKNKKIEDPLTFRLKQAYCQGRLFHYEQLQKDPNLLDWVLFKNFFTDDTLGPIPPQK